MIAVSPPVVMPEANTLLTASGKPMSMSGTSSTLRPSEKLRAMTSMAFLSMSCAAMILMPEDFQQAYEGVLQAVQDGTVSQERVDDSLKRIYRVKLRDRVAG